MIERVDLDALPTRPGVYLFRDHAGSVIYVGKARSLRSRVRSYFQSAKGLSAKTLRLRQVAERLEFITTATEAEALLLEENLIKVHRPKYNVILRDDKHYPFLRLARDGFARLEVVRSRRKDGARYFGPYPGAGAMHETLRLMGRIFPLRTCSDHKFRTVGRPCLLYHIHRCPGPCAGLISLEDYRAIADSAGDFLDGRHDKVIRQLQAGMKEASESLAFERAAELRDRLRAVEKVRAEQAIVLAQDVNADALALSREGSVAVADAFVVREGKVLGRRRYVFRITPEEEDAAVMAAAIRTHFGREDEVPPRVWVSTLPEDLDDIRSSLEGRRGRRVTLTRPERGDGRHLIDIVRTNADDGLMLERDESVEAQAALEALADALSLPSLPHRIEGYDISNTQGTLSVASMVVFEGGMPASAMYRRFNIRTVEGADDFASHQEAIRRRFGRADDSRDTSFSRTPDLLLIDGGKGQVSSVAEALAAIGVEVPMVGLAKREEWLYLPDASEPVVLARTHPGLRLLQRVRDEAHRFANTAHARRRAKSMKRSRLDDVPGLGPKRRRALLRHFGSVAAIRRASLEEIRAVGVPKEVAQHLLDELGSESS